MARDRTRRYAAQPARRTSKRIFGGPDLSLPIFTSPATPPLEAVGLREVNPTDVHVMAQTVYGEARGEALEVQAAVAWVIVTRVIAARRNPGQFARWGSVPAEVCMKRFQFSCWLPGDPNLPMLRDARAGEQVFNRALGIVALVLAGSLANPCAAPATHYFNVGPGLPPAPEWATASNMSPVVGPKPMTWFREGSWS